ncbi:unnamed protein product, partial [Prunus brigantina]
THRVIAESIGSPWKNKKGEIQERNRNPRNEYGEAYLSFFQLLSFWVCSVKIGSSGFGFGDSVPSEALSFFYPSEISLFAVKVIEILGREEKSSTLFSFIFIF